ncbi:hypothetical protein T296_19500 [Pantoea agglomerans Eh318]|nr:hypothetical protein T296_19500 [Pantoea agglomerans Eh318]
MFFTKFTHTKGKRTVIVQRARRNCANYHQKILSLNALNC